MPVRATATLAATAVAVVLLLSFRTPSAASIATLTPPTSSSSTSAPAATATPSAAPPSGGGSPAPTSKPSASTLKSGTFTGQSEANPFGSVQVQLVISGGKITAVKTLQYPNAHQQSVFINQQAIPLLQQEILSAQSAQINLISGATYTSYGYAQSVQSALDLARA